jgi:RimJ/RimL family protein N-acetyltransferase
MAHWAKIMANPALASRTILFGDRVAGQIGAWSDEHDRLVGYRIGKEFWSRGIATAALTQFVRYETTRPLTARVVKHNVRSIRVLEKCGFMPVGTETFTWPDGTPGEESILKLP